MTTWWRKADRLLELQGKTRRDVAKAVRLSMARVYDWMSGRAKAPPEFVYHLAQYLGVDLEWLLNDKDSSEWNPAAQAVRAAEEISDEVAEVIAALADERKASILAALASALERHLPAQEAAPPFGRPSIRRREQQR